MSLQAYEKYFPNLAILETQEILEQVAPDWKLSIQSISRREADQRLLPWVSFCEQALAGYDNAVNSFSRHSLILDARASRSYLLFATALGAESASREKIVAVQSAFAQLVSQDLQDQLATEINLDLPVEPNLQKDVNKLVGQMYRLALAHEAETRREWQKVEGKD